MKAININATLSGAGLDTATSLAAQILGNANVRHWFQADASSVTESGDGISVWADRKDSGITLVSASGNRAALTGAAINGYSAALFDPAALDKAVFTGTAPDLNAAHSWVVFTKPLSAAASRAVFSSFTTSSSMDGLAYDVTNSYWFYRHGSVRVINIPVTVGAWNAHILSTDASNIRVRANGVEMAPLAKAGSPGTAQIYIGSLNSSSQYFDGYISDLLYIDGCVLDNPTLMSALREFALDVYGVTL